MGVTSVQDTESGVLNLDEGVKAKPRVDFRPTEFDILIETKGYRIAWSRAALCPCASDNDQTQQPAINCSLCRGSGYFYFPPAQATVDLVTVGGLDTVQLRIVNDAAAVIRGIMTGVSADWQQYDPLGSRLEGTMNLTVRAPNRIGYHDRITNLDSVIVYQETIDMPAGTLVVPTRYPVVQVNLLRTETTTFTSPADYTLANNGDIVFVTGKEPSASTKFVCHYLCHPTWLITQYPHMVRTTQIIRKKKKPLTPVGDPTFLPNQGVARYEFLPELA